MNASEDGVARLAALQLEFARRCGPQRAALPADESVAASLPSAERLRFFRNGLRLKRLGEVRAMMPHARAAAGGERFDAAFLAFAETYEPLGFARHRDDAIAFAATLPSAAARVERAALLAARNVRGIWIAFGSRELVAFVRPRRGARLRRFSLALGKRR